MKNTIAYGNEILAKVSNRYNMTMHQHPDKNEFELRLEILLTMYEEEKQFNQKYGFEIPVAKQQAYLQVKELYITVIDTERHISLLKG